MVDQIFSPSDYSYVMNDLKDCPNLEDESVGKLLEPLQVFNHNEPSTYDVVPYESKPAVKKRKVSDSKQCDSTIHTVPTAPNVELPCLTEFPGQFEFQLQLPNEVSAPHRWTFSPTLKKVFIDIEKVLALQFKFKYFELKQDVRLFVRALPVYTSPDWMRHPVMRCPLHVLPDNPTNQGFPYVEHIIRCEHNSTRYDKDEFSGRYSCVTPLSHPQPGSDTTTLTYKFVCKTSCPSGMDRKSISVVFTLEDINGLVYGRQPLAVKICSCPKRDKVKEEQQNENEKKISTRATKARSTASTLSVRASKTPNNENLKDMQNDTETSSSSSIGCRRITKKTFIAQKKVMNNDIMDAMQNLKEDIMKEVRKSRNVDSVQSFTDNIAAQLRELSPHHVYEAMVDIQKVISVRRSAMYDPRMNSCLTPATSIASPESVDYESLRAQQNSTPITYRNNWNPT